MKRFTDTTKWADPWFQDLNPTMKVIWAYLHDNCDNAGVWKVNIALMNYQCQGQHTRLDVSVSSEEILSAFGKEVEVLDLKRWFFPSFIPFQYGTLSLKSKPHQAVIEQLTQHGIQEKVFEGYPKGIETSQERKGTDTGSSLSGKAGKPGSPDDVRALMFEKGLDEEQAVGEADKFWNFYEAKGWVIGKSPMRKWRSAVANWLKRVPKPELDRAEMLFGEDDA